MGRRLEEVRGTEHYALRIFLVWDYYGPYFFDVSECCCEEWVLRMILLRLTPVLSHSVIKP